MLLPVVVAIVLLAAITYMLGNQAVNQANIASGELERDRLRYVAEAGIAHAKLQLSRNTSCANYADVPKTVFAGEDYTAQLSPKEGSPVRITASVDLESGQTLNLYSDAVPAYGSPNTVMLQLSATDGKDVMIDSFYGNANYGSIDDLTVRSDPSWIQRPLLEFDLSAIPAGVQIVSAILDLELRIVSVPGSIGVHRMTRSWIEGTGKGTGNADGATWNDHDGDLPWSQAGGDFDSTLYATASVSSANNGQRVSWNVRDLVDGWVSGQFPNYGLALVGDGTVNNAEFESREEPDPAAAPRLTIVYACECGKACAAAPPAGKNVLLVVVDPVSLTAQEAEKQALIESWGHTVNLINESAVQAEFDAAVAVNDVAYVAEDISSGTLGTKLREATIGVVIEEQAITDEFGISSGNTTFSEGSINITDNTHYITSTFNTGEINFASSFQAVGAATGTLAPGLQILAVRPSSSTGMLDVIEAGGVLYDSGTAAGRRVKLPWGGNDFDINSLTADGQTIMQRAIEWGAGEGAATGTLPIAHWKFDEGSGATAVDSAGGHDGDLQNGPAWVTGRIGGGLSFDDLDDRVLVPHSDTLTLTDQITLMGWIQKNSVSGLHTVIEKSSGPLNRNYYLGSPDDKISFGFNTSILIWVGFQSTAANLQTGVWYHIAATFDNALDDVRMYLDGAEIDSFSTTQNPVTNSTAIYLGNSPDDIAPFDGLLDDLRIYDVALTAAEIAEIAAEGGPTGPIAHWKLDDGMGTTALDSVGGHDGTLTNGPVWVAGQLGDALNFSGNDDYVNVPHADALSLTDMTISLWLNTPTLNNVYQTMVRKKQQANYQLTTWEDEVVFAFNDGSGMKLFQTTGAGLTTNTWHHVVATLDDTSGDIDIYVDGSPVYSTTTTFHPLPNTEPLTLGGVPDASTYWPGMLDDIRLFDRVLSATEVADLYTGGSGGGGGDGGGDGGGGGSCDGNFRDNFDARVWNGSNGTLSWASDWIEVGESNGPTSGDIQVMENLTEFTLRTRDNDNGGEGVEREADLSGAATATLNYDYRRMNLDNTSDYTSVEVSANGSSGPWTELTRHDGSGNDANYQPASHPITDYISANTRIRFKTSSTMGATDTVYFDNIEIVCTP